jgi:hypothetical protein
VEVISSLSTILKETGHKFAPVKGGGGYGRITFIINTSEGGELRIFKE